ncbi:MAG TPA: ABC transporter permease [Dongiaceae bacterium]|jgi:spermidine/putrescine transport system permease protein
MAVADRRNRGAIVALTGPAYLWLTATIFLPLSAMLYVSFLDKSPLIPQPSSFTLKQYTNLVDKPVYGQLMVWSLELGAVVTLCCLIVGYPAALALAKVIKGRWREAMFLMVVLPFWSNALVRTFSWTMVLRSGGLADQAIHIVAPDAPALNVLYSYPAVVIGLVHSYLPYMILTCYISLQAIDDSVIEAARSLGARSGALFRRVVFPMSLPGVVAGSALIFVPAVGSFMEPRILGGAKGATLGMAIEEQFTVTANWPFGAALSFAMLAAVLLICLVLYPAARKRMEGL